MAGAINLAGLVGLISCLFDIVSSTICVSVGLRAHGRRGLSVPLSRMGLLAQGLVPAVQCGAQLDSAPPMGRLSRHVPLRLRNVGLSLRSVCIIEQWSASDVVRAVCTQCYINEYKDTILTTFQAYDPEWTNNPNCAYAKCLQHLAEVRSTELAGILRGQEKKRCNIS